jgi:hypothetical protein
MSAIIDNLTTAQKFLNILTWKKLIQLTVFLFIIGLTWATYENREVIYGFASQKRIDPASPHIQSLSRKTIEEIDAVSERSELIVGIQIALADFQKNQRSMIYTNVDSEHKELKAIYAKSAMYSITDVPLFSGNVDDNRHLVNLINGEFICRPFSGTVTARVVPDAAEYIQFTCTNGIPASYGRFTGIIMVNLKRQPTPEEYEQIRSISRALATTIFERDLSKAR